MRQINDDIFLDRDSVIAMVPFEKFLKLSDEEKNNINEESFNKLRRV